MVSPRSVFMGGVRKEEEEKMYDASIDNSLEFYCEGSRKMEWWMKREKGLRKQFLFYIMNKYIHGNLYLYMEFEFILIDNEVKNFI